MQAVAAALKAGKQNDAVRLLLDALQHHVPPTMANLSAWLVQQLGTRPAAKMLKALAHYPCFYCKNGLAKCDMCQGKPHRSCNHCLDLKLTRCDFCDGAGWVTYNVAPMSLWLPMIVERSGVGAAQLKKLLDKPLPAASPKTAAATRAKVEKELLLLNRLAGIFENAQNAAQKLRPRGPKEKSQIAVIIKRSRKAWSLIEPRMRQTLKRLAEAMTHEVAGAAPADQKRLKARIEICKSIADSEDFDQSSLWHPFLSDAE